MKTVMLPHVVQAGGAVSSLPVHGVDEHDAYLLRARVGRVSNRRQDVLDSGPTPSTRCAGTAWV